ncbi:protein associated with UVRAG as autophagy enhancer [Pelodytes ibericus]
MNTMAVANSVNLLPRIPTILFPEDELPRPAVIGLSGNRASHTNSTTAIKEILASVLNIPSSVKSKLLTNAYLQDSDTDDPCSSNDSSDTDSDYSCVPIVTCPQNNRPKVCWDNTQTDSMSSTLDQLPLSPKVSFTNPQKVFTELELASFPIGTNMEVTGPDIRQLVNLPLLIGAQKDSRRFSSPNLSNQVFTFDVTSRKSALDSRSSTEDRKQSGAEDLKSFHRRSQSYSSVLTVSDEMLASNKETLHQPTENIFEPTVNLENENEHFLVADLFISTVEKMKSGLQRLQYEQWKSENSKCWLTKDPKEISYNREKKHSESATSVDSGYEGFAAVPSRSLSEPILEETCEDDHFDDEFVIIELEDCEKLCGPDTAQESPIPEPGANSAEQTAKKLYRALREQWLQTDEEALSPGTPNPCIRLVNKETIPKEFESSWNLEEEIKRFKMSEVKEWSPPRFQIINTIHPYIKRDVIVASQNYLCAGCGTKVEQSYTNRLRYCDYLGKYFCDCCHTYAESSIPARIILKWNFSKYYVSNFSKNLLDRIWESHKFHVLEENPAFYKKTRDLNRVKELQEQLIQIKKLLMACRFADSILKAFQEVPAHLTEQLHVFTLSDLLKVKQSLLLPDLRQLLTTATDHVDNCELCQAKGFICEFCQSDDILFAFQTQTCARCEGCKACFHKKCFKTSDCPKCRRIQARVALLRCSSPTSPSSNNDSLQ